jgi:glycosyltransferase involved in cell wall biosynthesis
MRILHIDTGREMRGGQHQALLLMEGLRQAGHECVLLARPNAALYDAAERDDIPVRPATMKHVFGASKASDVVHAHDARAHMLAAVAARAPLVVSRRVAFPVARSILSAWKYKRPARFIAVSRCVAGELTSAGVPWEKIDVVYDGVECSHASFAWNPAGPMVALASRDPRKGRDLVERAAAISGKQVIFSETLSRDLSGASLFVYITRSEGLGSAALLAMSAGVPVIASRIGGLPEVIVDGLTGILVENEPEEIAGAICRISDDAALVSSLVDRARSRVAECFSRENLTAETLACYRRALAV